MAGVLTHRTAVMVKEGFLYELARSDFQVVPSGGEKCSICSRLSFFFFVENKKRGTVGFLFVFAISSCWHTGSMRKRFM